MISRANVTVARRRLRSVCLPVWVIVSLGFLLGACRAAVVIGNLPSNDEQGLSIGNSNQLAVSFQMPNQDAMLDQVTLRLKDIASGKPSVSLHLNSSSSNTPGVLFVSLTGPNPTSTAADLDYTSGSTVTLQANTGYWLVVAAQSGQFDWNGSISPVDPSGLATFGGFRKSVDDGVSWGVLTTPRPSFAINGTAVPEPPGGSLLVGLFCCVFVYFRRQAKTGS